ncbi:MAG TPA: hypothetical protein V6C81_26850 [Planktothrix sp.]|jgi:cellobiose-specific phosphotransferase system component IIA
MTFQPSDRAAAVATPARNDASASMMADVNNQLMRKTKSDSQQRPSDPHYVAQTDYDANQGLKELNSGKFDQGKASLDRSLSDLNKEQGLISKGQKGETSAAKDILNGNEKNAEQQLQDSLKAMKGNGFTADARQDDRNALAALKGGHEWAAEKDIANGELTLQNRDQRVSASKSDIQQGLKNFDSGKFDTGEEEIRDGMKQLSLKPHPIIDPVPVRTASSTDSGSSELIHNGVMEIPQAASLYS